MKAMFKPTAVDSSVLLLSTSPLTNSSHRGISPIPTASLGNPRYVAWPPDSLTSRSTSPWHCAGLLIFRSTLEISITISDDAAKLALGLSTKNWWHFHRPILWCVWELFNYCMNGLFTCHYNRVPLPIMWTCTVQVLYLEVYVIHII